MNFTPDEIRVMLCSLHAWKGPMVNTIHDDRTTDFEKKITTESIAFVDNIIVKLHQLRGF